ncbi:MAG: FHA domain-containing protein [Propionibacteriaceae bacterium]|nr:FHA domain-containing protein [Propionibacteriaceae bacterium]
MPVVEAPQAQPTPVEVTVCPNCESPRPGAALFCESCGYDYTTGALPDQDLRSELGLPPTASDTPQKVEDPMPEAQETPEASQPEQDSSTPEVPLAIPASPSSKFGAWVAEVWVDPQWYAFQESTDPIPAQGPPRIVRLKDRALIGRHSASRNIFPDIDCEPDVGCSRRQAFLTWADGYWYVNDLESANGTFVASSSASLPDEPIAARTQITPDMRIYVGAWTRIVVRPAVAADLS